MTKHNMNKTLTYYLFPEHFCLSQSDWFLLQWRPVCRDLIWLSVFTSFNSLVEQHDSTKSLCVTSGQQRMKALITLWLPLSTSAVSSDCDACYSLRKSFLKQWRSNRLSTKVLTFSTLKTKAQRISVGRLEAKGLRMVLMQQPYFCQLITIHWFALCRGTQCPQTRSQGRKQGQ